jgi:hypothetical protein
MYHIQNTAIVLLFSLIINLLGVTKEVQADPHIHDLPRPEIKFGRKKKVSYVSKRAPGENGP